ncbi:MAG TPA: Ig-like domain repeat protein [Terriglobales bacterium]|nr:Ig-like domain repeat protein [Terriglobales bacterium]
MHPLAQTRYDRGAVPDSFPADRVLLLLSRPAEREAALREFMSDVHRRGSASYHQWLTPLEYGRRFGPADSDVQTAEGWLKSQGFKVARVTKSKQFIEFSGTAGQLRTAFHTEIHQYEVAGEAHYANAGEISIPAALAPLVRGVSPLNDFRAKPYVKVAGPALYSRTTKKTTPQWTIPNPFGTPNPYAYPVAPEDFATQYDLAPLYQAGVNGTGETIGIINESNIDLSLVNAYQQLFGLPSNPTQVVIDGDDPGTLIVNGVDVEAYLDVEVSGAVAPQATVNLYISNGSNFQDPLALAAIRAIEDNQASVLSVSFGQCEVFLGNAGNQLWSGLWEQAAAQGQTVFVAAGDSGPYCDYDLFMSVSGIASTPWNVAVGGTDFYYSDYATGGASATNLWNQTNDPNQGSLKAPLPEQVWNDPFGLDVISNGLQRNEIFAGGGGASSCSTQNSSTGDCTSGYAKPSWQTGPGVPADLVRDLPDVSLFASNGANLSTYPICAYEGECAAGTNSAAEILLVGGTSGSSPAMAGIMALVNQKYGRQGQANFTLYPLAQQKPTAFHDITLGSNDSPCSDGMPDCTLNANGYYATTIYPAGPGYDQASGLGSVDANVLVNNWSSVTFLPTTTTLSLSSAKITHGTPITVTTSVAPASGSGTPTGSVAILTTSTLPSSQSQTVLALSGGTASSSIDFFPGGYYDVSANYHGDGVYGTSTSSPVALTVTPENSNINFQILNGYPPNPATVGNGGSVQYNTPLYFVIQPAGVSAPTGKTNGNATGSATFKVDSITATVPLNAVGVASWAPPALATGNHTASATYSGDASFNASSGSAVTFSVTPGLVLLNDNEIGPYSETGAPGLFMNVGSTLTVGVTAQGWDTFGANPVQIPQATAAPTGTVQVCLGTYPGLYNDCQNPVYSQTVTLAPVSGADAQDSLASATFPNLAANQYYVSMVYSGDSHWGSTALLDTRAVIVQSMPPAATTATTVSITPSSFSGTQTAVITGTVTGSGDPGTAPVGLIDFFADGVFLTYSEFASGVAGTTSSLSFEVNPSWFLNSGANQLIAVYEGGGGNGPSVSSAVNFTAVQTGGDFTLAPQLPQVTVQPGSSGTVGLNLASLSNFNGVVTLTCTPSSSNITCGVSPSAPTLNGTATATLTINAAAQAAALPAHSGSRLGWLGTGFMFASVLLGGFTNRRRRLGVVLGLVLFAALLVAAGCGSGGGQAVQPPPPANPGTYSVVVSATSNVIIHNAKITVIVP